MPIVSVSYTVNSLSRFSVPSYRKKKLFFDIMGKLPPPPSVSEIEEKEIQYFREITPPTTLGALGDDIQELQDVITCGPSDILDNNDIEIPFSSPMYVVIGNFSQGGMIKEFPINLSLHASKGTLKNIQDASTIITPLYPLKWNVKTIMGERGRGEPPCTLFSLDKYNIIRKFPYFSPKDFFSIFHALFIEKINLFLERKRYLHFIDEMNEFFEVFFKEDNIAFDKCEISFPRWINS